MEAVAGRVPVIAHIGVLATRDSVELARHADALGVAAVSSVPPFYFKFSRDEYMGYYRAILDATHCPLLLYNVPAMSGVALSDEDVGFFFQEERIIGLKFTSGDLFQLERLIRSYPNHAFFSGLDEIYLPALAAGARAAIGSTYNFMASKFVKIRERFLDGDLASARALQGEANDLIETLLSVGMIKGVKAVLSIKGVDCGAARPPFSELDEASMARVRAAVERNL
jgi:N-acetylneuraminate lyase